MYGFLKGKRVRQANFAQFGYGFWGRWLWVWVLGSGKGASSHSSSSSFQTGRQSDDASRGKGVGKRGAKNEINLFLLLLPFLPFGKMKDFSGNKMGFIFSPSVPPIHIYPQCFDLFFLQGIKFELS